MLGLFKQLRLTIVVDGWPSIGLAPLQVDFTADVTGVKPYVFAWQFGDGGSSSEMNPTHIFKTAGSFKVVCQVTDRLQRTASDEMIVTVNAEAPVESTPPPPTGDLVVKASGSPNNGSAPLQVNFTSTPSGGVPPYSYTWDFGDGLKSTLQNPQHVYEKSGDYTAGLTVQDSAGHMNFALVQIKVQAPSQPPTTAPLDVQIYGPYPAQPKVGDAVSFESSVSEGSAPYNYQWSGSDGWQSNYQNPVWYPEAPGTYRISLTVKDAENRTGSTYVDLVVSA